MDKAGKEVTKKKLMKAAEEESTLRLKYRENLQGVPKVSRSDDLILTLSLTHYPRTPHNRGVSQVRKTFSS